MEPTDPMELAADRVMHHGEVDLAEVRRAHRFADADRLTVVVEARPIADPVVESSPVADRIDRKKQPEWAVLFCPTILTTVQIVGIEKIGRLDGDVRNG